MSDEAAPEFVHGDLYYIYMYICMYVCMYVCMCVCVCVCVCVYIYIYEFVYGDRCVVGRYCWPCIAHSEEAGLLAMTRLAYKLVIVLVTISNALRLTRGQQNLWERCRRFKQGLHTHPHARTRARTHTHTQTWLRAEAYVSRILRRSRMCSQ
jgi:hypothetical protein